MSRLITRAVSVISLKTILWVRGYIIPTNANKILEHRLSMVVCRIEDEIEPCCWGLSTPWVVWVITQFPLPNGHVISNVKYNVVDHTIGFEMFSSVSNNEEKSYSYHMTNNVTFTKNLDLVYTEINRLIMKEWYNVPNTRRWICKNNNGLQSKIYLLCYE